MDLTSARQSADFFRDQYHEKGRLPNYEDYLALAYAAFLKGGDNIIDIGAHSGRHLKNFVDIIGDRGRAWAFEPIPYMAAYLRQEYDRFENVRIEEMALSNNSGKLEFVHVQNAPEESGLKQRIFNSDDRQVEKIEVQVVVGDEYFSKRDRKINYIKIDTEGGEIGCLEGLRQTIMEDRPIISVEYGFPAYSCYDNKRETLYEISDSLDMKLSDLFGNIVKDLEEWNSVVDKAYWDYFMIPAEKTAGWKENFSDTPFPFLTD